VETAASFEARFAPRSYPTIIRSPLRAIVLPDRRSARTVQCGERSAMVVPTASKWITSSGSSLDRCAGLLLPSLNVHADHEEPHGQRSFTEDAGGKNIGGQMACKRW